MTIIEKQKVQNNFWDINYGIAKFYFDNDYKGNIVSVENGIVTLDFMFGTFLSISKVVKTLYDNLEEFEKEILCKLNKNIRIVEIRFDFNGHTVVTTAKMSLEEICEACYKDGIPYNKKGGIIIIG